MADANPLQWPIDVLAWVYGKLFQGHPYIGGIVVCSVGALLCLGLYVKAMDKYGEDHPIHEKVASTPTFVTLQFNQQDSTPVIIESKNLWRTTWFAYNFAEKETGRPLGKSWAIFLTFERAIPAKQVVATGHGQPLPAYQIVDASSKSAIIVFSEDIVNKVVTINVEN